MSVPWLRDLEDKVHAASERLRALEEENLRLRRRLEELEAAPDDEAAAWRDERDDVRRRVEGLVEHLERLLAAPEPT